MTVASTFTIAAIATGSLPCAIGVIRISGPAALGAARRVAPGLPAAPRSRHAYLTVLRSPDGEVLDEAIVLYFAAPASFTGEDVVEFQVHGAPLLLTRLLRLVVEHPEVRHAEPGEFSRRAFLLGRRELSRLEGIAELMHAGTSAGLKAAAAQIRGVLHHRVAALRREWTAILADVEALLAYPDEAAGADAELSERLDQLRRNVGSLLGEARRGQLLRKGPRVALVGPVNAGKSTLFNRLLGEDRALVDDEPGTTRDVLEARVVHAGVELTFVDTAGLRDDLACVSRVEEMGIGRALEEARAADLLLVLLPPGAHEDLVQRFAPDSDGRPVVVVQTKIDLTPARAGALGVSSLTGEGVTQLWERIQATLGFDETIAEVQLTSERHLDVLRRAAVALNAAREAVDVATTEVVAAELLVGLSALGELTGESVTQEVLDGIFSRFCIGK